LLNGQSKSALPAHLIQTSYWLRYGKGVISIPDNDPLPFARNL